MRAFEADRARARGGGGAGRLDGTPGRGRGPECGRAACRTAHAARARAGVSRGIVSLRRGRGGADEPQCDLYAVGFQELGSGGIGVGGAGGKGLAEQQADKGGGATGTARRFLADDLPSGGGDKEATDNADTKATPKKRALRRKKSASTATAATGEGTAAGSAEKGDGKDSGDREATDAAGGPTCRCRTT